jgi:hypothetical protein
MSKRNRGRPKGSTKSFLTDPDRFVVSMIDGLEAVNPQLKFEHIAMFAIYFHHDLQIEMGPNPLMYVRRLKLSKEVREKLCDGYHIQRWGPDKHSYNADKIGNRVDTIRRKIERLSVNTEATRWRYYMRLLWTFLLSAPNAELAATVVREAAEEDYVLNKLLPKLELAFGRD